MDVRLITTFILALNLIAAFYFNWMPVNKILVIANAFLLIGMIAYKVAKR